MSNPWTKKNPLMSLWLSHANAASGHVRAQVTKIAKRQVGAATSQAMRDYSRAWLAAFSPRRRK